MCCNYHYMSVGNIGIIDHENWVDEDIDLKLNRAVGEFEVNH